ncbi:hypothetical protein [Trujillonella humicola]|uniref:hypothetical protein n=1 Tax=Trujillonella humicola TaxID=3383699 RepID=UPI003905E5D6
MTRPGDDRPSTASGAGEPAPPVAEPTVRLDRRPASGRRGETAGGRPPRPAHPDDEATVDLPRPAPPIRQPTVPFGTPVPVRVTVRPRVHPRRRRTWPWIAAVVVALLVVGAVLAVMLLRGDTVDTRLDAPGTAPAAPGPPFPGSAIAG